jgi:sugar phosphate isomerase/epimerase
MDDAVRAIKLAISVTAEIEASGIVMPIAAAPSLGTTSGLRPYLLEALAELAGHAESAGTAVLVEPLNRYEDGEINRLEQAVQLCEEVGSAALSVCADLFHMNIEERDAAEAIRTAGDRLRHLHVADSNRRQPGAGHLDFPGPLGALRTAKYGGWLALEYSLDEPAQDALRMAVHVLQDAWEAQHAAAAAPGSPGRQDDAPSSSFAAPGTTFATTAHR